MVGRKVNVKLLSSELRKKGVQMLRTTEFVQGRTSRWGLAWTFNMQEGNMLSEQAISANKSSHFFMLEVRCQYVDGSED
jgi:23S rRNA (adenine1618-N6)-methyltransferase